MQGLQHKEKCIENYVLAQWAQARVKMRSVIEGQPNAHVLREPFIGGTMVRTGFEYPQRYEVAYLKYCTRKETYDTLKAIPETDFGDLSKECAEFKCTTNTLGHLFYAARVLEHTKKTPRVLVEFGGGYGNLARLFAHVYPDATIFIIDLPEFNALQWLFLKRALPQKNVLLHSSIPDAFQDGSIHLIPLHLLDELSINTDIFISTFGLSECPLALQDCIIEKNFFNASTCYIAGQLLGWSGLYEHHEQLIRSIQKKYTQAMCQPFHFFSTQLMSYEVIGQGNL